MSATIDSIPAIDSSSSLPLTSKRLIIALAGNPNAGKTSLFNLLTGLRQKVANYPGVTVERKEGTWNLSANLPPARLIDLPGLYSLEAISIDEQIARDIIDGRTEDVPAPDVIVAVVDATNLERNLYLVTQILEHGRPVVIALTMMDLAERRGIEINIKRLATMLGVPVVPVITPQRKGLDTLAEAVIQAANKGIGTGAGWKLSERTEEEIETLIGQTNGKKIDRANLLLKLYNEDLAEEDTNYQNIIAVRKRLASIDKDWWQEPLLARYRWIEHIVAETVHGETARSLSTERIDRWLTHKFIGPLILLVIMLVVFQTIFSWAELPMNLIDSLFGSLGDLVRNQLPAGLFTDLLVDGIIAGVGGVMVFLPQITLLFLFIAILEDTGYMARAAFLMDRLMRGAGLHGKAFMPLLSSFACAIPGIMAARTIENPKDRLATILIAPFMSCSARLPVYTLMIAAFFTDRKILGVLSVGTLVIMSMYLLGIVVAVCVAWILKHTILKGPPPPLVMEMPPYRIPNIRTIIQTIVSRAWLFIWRAGTVILAISIVLWALVTFPRSSTIENRISETVEGSVRSEVVTEESDQLSNSFAGMAGRTIEPIIEPLGFDWKMGVGLISSFAARETIVSTLSIIYNVGKESEADSPSLIEAVQNAKRADGTPAWTPLTAVSLMVFFVLACQCMSTVAIVRRETNSWRWPIFMVVYMTVVAYVASLITYQGGKLLGFS
jgi:ferrous iron transport protein B